MRVNVTSSTKFCYFNVIPILENVYINMSFLTREIGTLDPYGRIVDHYRGSTVSLKTRFNILIHKKIYKYIHWKNSIAKRTIFWSLEPENIAIRPMLRYGPQNYTSIGETAIQVRWYDNTMYSDQNQNIMPSLSLLWIFACEKTIRDTEKWSFKERKNAPNKLTNASKKRLEKMTLLSHFEVKVACMWSNV